ncbi:MAG: alpha/beta hydrolase [Bdellovibrionales bacterium]|nr:alpha/beta hydrolase [Bdellovibrionales bacterium]
MGISEPWVLLRGLMRHSGHWGAFGGKLQQEFPSSKILLLDLPGNGTKWQLSTPTNVNEIIDILREEVHRATGTTPFHFLGMSLGAMVGLKWAQRYPESFRAIIAINPSLKQYSKPWQRLRPQSLFGIMAAIFARDSFDREKAILHLTSSNKPADLGVIAQSYADFDSQWPLRRNNFFRQMLLASKILLNEPVKVPLTILASENDRLVSSRCSSALAQFLSSRLAVHPTAGHDLVLDDPDWVISEIKSIVFQAQK